jgi:hypothetical protein
MSRTHVCHSDDPRPDAGRGGSPSRDDASPLSGARCSQGLDTWRGEPILSSSTDEPATPVVAEGPPSAAAPAVERPLPVTGWRRWVPWVLIVLAGLIALFAALNIWVKRQALSTDNWTEASTRLLENEDIRSALSVYLVDQLYSNVDVGKALEERLPPGAQQLGAPLAAALQPALVRTTDTLLGRPRVQQLWQNANRRTHQLFIALIDGKHGVLQTTDGNVVLDLRPLLQELEERTGIGGRVQERLPPDAGQIVILKGNQLGAARDAVKVIRALSYLLSFLILALFAVAIYLARGRRRTMLLAAGATLLIVGLLVLVARRFAGDYIVDALTTNPDAKDSVTATWAIGTELLRDVGINVVVYGVLILLAAWIAGPSRPAVAFRRVSAPTMRDHPVVVYGLVSLVLLVVLLAGPTDGQRVYPLLVLFALAIVGTEILRRQTEREFPPMVGAP